MFKRIYRTAIRILDSQIDDWNTIEISKNRNWHKKKHEISDSEAERQ